jgi:DNA-directed RNA polymerase subunit N (RpoN/RPB10)
MALYQLPMLECSNCGQHLGHKYEDYYTLTKQLVEELKTKSVPTGTYTASDGDDISAFINIYYSWYTNPDRTEPVPQHEPGNIVARALLRLRELNSQQLPFGSAREDDGQISIYEPRICCMRMFQTDPMMTKI